MLYADHGGPIAARLAQWFEPAGGFQSPLRSSAVNPFAEVPLGRIEVRDVDGGGSRIAEPDPMHVILPGPTDADPMIDELAATGLQLVLEQGEWRGELLGLEVARIVRWPVESGGDGALHIEAGVGRFDRVAAAALHQGESPAEALERAMDIVSTHRHMGAVTHPLSLLARSRWLRSMALSAPELVGAADLRPVETAFCAGSVREERPAAALGRCVDGTPVLVVFATGAALDLLPVATDARELHLPGGFLKLVVPPRDHMRSTDELVAWAAATGRGPVELIEMEPPWTT